MTTKTDEPTPISSLMDFEKVQAVCPRCGKKHEARKIVLPGGKVVEKMLCPECSESERKNDEANRSASANAERQSRWDRICPPLYRLTDPARLPPKQLKAVMEWQYGQDGLLLIGPTGTGKTRAAYLLLRRLLDEGRQVRTFSGIGFGHACERNFSNNNGPDWSNQLVKAEVVFFDDLGKVRLTDRTESELFGIIEARIANCLPIIATSNMTGNDLAGKMSQDRGAPLVRRLREFCKVVIFK